MKKILAIIGARPQFIKHAPIEIALQGKTQLISVHTGQHYDHNMSQIFFDELGMSVPKYMLSVGSHTHGVQTGKMMIKIEEILLDEEPDYLIVYGDTNSTLAGALVGAKLKIPVIHIEAGIRSFNKEMPEEINRILTDHMSAILFVPTDKAISNLSKEGIKQNVHLVGDVMKDMVMLAKQKNILIGTTSSMEEYYYATIHRPYNTDDKSRLEAILTHFNQLSFPVRFSIHPRTKHKMKAFGLVEENYTNIIFCEPLSYFDNMKVLYNSKALITDSGGMQKEAYWLKRKCITIRSETEWVETLHDDWNTLIFDDLSNLKKMMNIQPSNWKAGLYGSGNGAEEIVELLLSK